MTPPTFRQIRLAVLLLAAGLVLWAFLVEPQRLVLREETLALPRWPAPLAGLRVALLADLHVGSPFVGRERLERIVERTQAARPDLVLILGDLVIHDVLGGERVLPEVSAPILGRLRAPLGVYAVLGNHDVWFDGPRVAACLERAGIPVLTDANRALAAPGGRLWLAGIGDAWTQKPDLAQALAGIPSGEAILAFTHNPDLFPRVPARVSLTLAGHTHGGQVFLPLVGRPIVPSRYGQRYAIGSVSEGGRHLYVSSGIGTSILPVRFRVPPEITLLRLEPAAAPARGRRARPRRRLDRRAAAGLGRGRRPGRRGAAGRSFPAGGDERGGAPDRALGGSELPGGG